MKKLILPILFLTLTSCGDNSPFDEDYWEDSNVRTEEDEGDREQVQNFTVEFTPLVEAAANIAGTATISVNETEVVTVTELNEVPQSLMIGQRSITLLTCEEVIATNPNPQISNNTGEFKSIDLTDTGTREALVAELNQADPQNGDSSDLSGKRFVVRAYVSNLNTPSPETTALIPIACGTILLDETEEDDGEDDGETTGGGTTGGTTGVTTGTTVGGGTDGTTVAGGVAGGIGGTIGTTAAGVAGGIGGTVGTTTTGAAGGVGGSVGTTFGGTTGF